MQPKEECEQTINFALLFYHFPLGPCLDVPVLPSTDEQPLTTRRKLNTLHMVKSVWPLDACIQLPPAPGAFPSPNFERNLHPKATIWIVPYVECGHPLPI